MILLKKYQEVRSHSLQLVEPLKTEDFVPQPVVDVSPPKWHLAHTTWFFEEMILSPNLSDYQVFHPRYRYVFNSYYESVGDRVARPHRGWMSRPTVEEVMEYRAYVDAHMQAFLQQEEQLSPEVRDLIELGLQHEQQHQELFWTDTKFTFSLNPLYPVYKQGGALLHQINEERGWLEQEGGMVDIGFEGEGFCFDNELNRHQAFLNPYRIRKDLVTNSDFMAFIEEDGYKRHEFWHSEGWDWVNQNERKAPLYWEKEGQDWVHFTMEGRVPVRREEILCHVNYYEAFAYAQWRGLRLPTEFEWEAAADLFAWGKRWEWTQSAYLPYPKYQKAAGAVGEYNGKFMVSQMVLRGASVATSPGHARKTYRNFFHPQLAWQFTGIRLAESL
ncbi:ergothioneine biosynthesis protein EgtB [Persicobacter diffluens]|uniref:Ergothioneine biosynthesis protein EgtB n=1 Tax=Persicobacter diffluens TaxID=981 RepID=A0AAN4W275_9BACT|nr:ergothioneine biosynthesis protein EgtB [Persicobacter diffluens]